MPVVIAIAVVGAVFLWLRSGGEERAIRNRLERLAGDINSGLTVGLDTVTRAVQIGSYFTEDVVIDLGRGTTPIEGRTLVVDMAARLQPRTGRFITRFADITVTLTGPTTADVSLTAEFIPRQGTEGTLDAREFAAQMVKDGGDWRIARVTAVQALR